MTLINLDRMKIITSDLVLYSQNIFIHLGYTSALGIGSFTLQNFTLSLTSDTVRCSSIFRQ